MLSEPSDLGAKCILPSHNKRVENCFKLQDYIPLRATFLECHGWVASGAKVGCIIDVVVELSINVPVKSISYKSLIFTKVPAV